MKILVLAGDGIGPEISQATLTVLERANALYKLGLEWQHDEIGFVTGHVVLPYIAPDVQISWALAHYYRLSSGLTRYQMVADQRRRTGASEPAKPATITMPSFTETRVMVKTW